MTEEELSEYSGPDRVVSSTEMRNELKNRPKNQVHFFSGLENLDKLIDGFQGGELIAVSGLPKSGKTLLCQTLTQNFADQKIKSLWVSFEVPIPQFLGQMPQACEFYLPRILKPMNPDWLNDRIVESKLKRDVRAIFIDHLHYLVDLAKGGRNFSVYIGQLVRGLKRTAVKNNIVIFLLCHSTKATTPTGEPRELNAFDIRDSSFVPQEADSTMIIQRKMDKGTKEYNNKAMVKVCNHRRTGVMEKRITLVKDGLLFSAEVENGEKPEKKPKYFYETIQDEPIPF